MTKILDIHDEHNLKNWILIQNLDKTVCLWLSSRACLRALPAFWMWSTAPSGKHLGSIAASPILRAAIINQVAVAKYSRELVEASIDASLKVENITEQVLSTAVQSFNSAASSSVTPTSAVNSALSYKNSMIGLNKFSAAPEKTAKTIAIAARIRSAMWEPVRKDCSCIGLGYNALPVQEPRLWHGDATAYSERWVILKHQLKLAAKSGNDWRFWIDWYNRALAGTEDRWDLLERIALSNIPRDGTKRALEDFNPFWEGTDAEVNENINEIWEDWKRKQTGVDIEDDDSLSLAEERTYNAEVITFDDDAQNWTATPVTQLASVFPEESIQDIEDLVNRLDAAQADGRNPLPITAELNMLRKAGHMIKSPRRLFGLCKRVMQRIDVKVANGDCPAISKDADLMDLFSTLTDVRLSMQKRDPEVAKTHALLEDTPEISSTDEAAIAISEAAEALASHTDGEMPEEFVEDAHILTDQNATPEMRRDALHQSSGRILRIWRWIISTENWEKAEKKTKPMAATVKNVTIIAGGLSSPAWLPTAIQYILKLFGS